MKQKPNATIKIKTNTRFEVSITITLDDFYDRKKKRKRKKKLLRSASDRHCGFSELRVSSFGAI